MHVAMTITRYSDKGNMIYLWKTKIMNRIFPQNYLQISYTQVTIKMSETTGRDSKILRAFKHTA